MLLYLTYKQRTISDGQITGIVWKVQLQGVRDLMRNQAMTALR